MVSKRYFTLSVVFSINVSRSFCELHPRKHSSGSGGMSLASLSWGACLLFRQAGRDHSKGICRKFSAAS
ncbi:hypothetical protein E2C01_081578 [Portunus trituberculatus]|uniref:Uncharacterized protein n=1 Tax=Portunus trituberculatus TaxID=210409 RepID=A0A5B7IS94_PORTR|nr:hypothetical protein [Portunus trituberculatus]